MADISGFGLELRVIASNTLPIGVQITEFADDNDPIDFPELTIAETAMGLNGDLITWSNANPVPFTLNLIPNQDNDIAMSLVGEANRTGRGKAPARDLITIVGVYPDGRTFTLTNGKMINYNPSNGIASAGRYKAKKFDFMFENMLVT